MASVRDNAQELRYELLDDSGAMIGEIGNVLEPGAVALVHTEVVPGFKVTDWPASSFKAP